MPTRPRTRACVATRGRLVTSWPSTRISWSTDPIPRLRMWIARNDGESQPGDQRPPVQVLLEARQAHPTPDPARRRGELDEAACLVAGGGQPEVRHPALEGEQPEDGHRHPDVELAGMHASQCSRRRHDRGDQDEARGVGRVDRQATEGDQRRQPGPVHRTDGEAAQDQPAEHREVPHQQDGENRRHEQQEEQEVTHQVVRRAGSGHRVEGWPESARTHTPRMVSG